MDEHVGPREIDPQEVGPREITVVGIGSPYRRDDGAGPAVLRRLAGMRAGDRPLTGLAALTTCEGDLTRLIALWEGKDSAFLVDAARSGEGVRPGTVRRFASGEGVSCFASGEGDFPYGPLPASSHGLGLAEALALGRALDRLPGRLVVYTVEAADTGVGHGLSEAVTAAVDEVAGCITAEIAGLAARPRLPARGAPSPYGTRDGPSEGSG